jgi:hypothetical protein
VTLTESGMIQYLEQQRKIINFYYENNNEWYIKNMDKINNFFDNITMGSMESENNYMKKYLKYKQKYLQLKKLNN